MFYWVFFFFLSAFPFYLVQRLSRTFAMDARVHLINMEFDWTRGEKKIDKRQKKQNEIGIDRTKQMITTTQKREGEKEKHMCDNCQPTVVQTKWQWPWLRAHKSFILNSLHCKMLQTTVNYSLWAMENEVEKWRQRERER